MKIHISTIPEFINVETTKKKEAEEKRNADRTENQDAGHILGHKGVTQKFIPQKINIQMAKYIYA